MMRESVEKQEDGRYEYYFKGDGYPSNKSLQEWLGELVGGKDFAVEFVHVRESDDADAPYDKGHDYEDADAVKTAMSGEIPEMDLESFYVEGKYGDEDVAVGASVFGPKNISIFASGDFEDEAFLKKLGIE